MSYAVRSFLICDDVRQEASGKQILIGVYLSSIVVKSVPVQLHQLAYRVVLESTQEKHRSARFTVKGSDGYVLLDSTMDANISDIEEDVVFVFLQRNVAIPKAQKYEVSFGLDGAMQKVGDFTLRLAKNDSESQALVHAT